MHPLTNLAKRAVESYIQKGEIISPPQGFPEEFLKRKAGVFVTIEKEEKLRGCIGTYLPTQSNIVKEVIKNAIAAATRDPRFLPIQKEELKSLSYTVSILHPPEKVNTIEELNPKRYGIIIKSLTNPLKSALLLPEIKGIEAPWQQVLVTAQKGGINLKEEKIAIYKFLTEKYQ